MKNITDCNPSRAFKTSLLKPCQLFAAIATIAALEMMWGPEVQAQAAVVGKGITLFQKYTYEAVETQFTLGPSKKTYIVNHPYLSYNYSAFAVGFGKNEVVVQYGKPADATLVTNNGLLAFRGQETEPYRRARIVSAYNYYDLNDLSVNRALAASPMGSLMIAAHGNSSDKTKVQWIVE
jgi:hypothetical protein